MSRIHLEDRCPRGGQVQVRAGPGCSPTLSIVGGGRRGDPPPGGVCTRLRAGKMARAREPPRRNGSAGTAVSDRGRQGSASVKRAGASGGFRRVPRTLRASGPSRRSCATWRKRDLHGRRVPADPLRIRRGSAGSRPLAAQAAAVLLTAVGEASTRLIRRNPRGDARRRGPGPARLPASSLEVLGPRNDGDLEIAQARALAAVENVATLDASTRSRSRTRKSSPSNLTRRRMRSPPVNASSVGAR